MGPVSPFVAVRGSEARQGLTALQRLKRIGAKIVASVNSRVVRPCKQHGGNRYAQRFADQTSHVRERIGRKARGYGAWCGERSHRGGSGGMDHTIDIAIVDAVKDGVVSLQTTAEETVRRWH